MKSPFYTASAWGSMSLKKILQTLIVSHIRSATHSISKMKLVILDLKELFVLGHVAHRHARKYNKSTRKINLYEPPTSVYYYNSTDDSQRSSEGVFQVMKDQSELSGYLNWLENEREVDEANEIDKLADLFIANCKERFMLEKQESYRMFQEMMARSI